VLRVHPNQSLQVVGVLVHLHEVHVPHFLANGAEVLAVVPHQVAEPLVLLVSEDWLWPTVVHPLV